MRVLRRKSRISLRKGRVVCLEDVGSISGHGRQTASTKGWVLLMRLTVIVASHAAWDLANVELLEGYGPFTYPSSRRRWQS